MPMSTNQTKKRAGTTKPRPPSPGTVNRCRNCGKPIPENVPEEAYCVDCRYQKPEPFTTRLITR